MQRRAFLLARDRRGRHRRRRRLPARAHRRDAGPGPLSRHVGHALRDGAVARAHARARGVAILGPASPAPSCAWKLAREGHADFVVVAGPAGTRRRRRAGRPGLSDGRALLPLPSRESTHARCWGRFSARSSARRRRRHALLRRNRAGPFAAGTTAARWPLGRQPAADAGPARADLAQHRRFLAQVQALHTRRGNDGRKVFAIPLTCPRAIRPGPRWMVSPSGNGWNARAIPRQPCAGI